MKCKLILTANAGVILEVDGQHILVDALHSEKTPGFSAVPPAVLTAIWQRYTVCAPTAVIATHPHPDHVSKALWNEARIRWPTSYFLSPDTPLEGTIVLKESQQRITLDGITIDAMRLPHEGAPFESVVHYGYFLDVKGFTVLIPGDCALAASDKVCELIAGRRVDLAVLNFPWVTLSKPRAFVRERIAPAHLALFHLPFCQDDCEDYRPTAQKASALMTGMDVRILSEPMQEVDIF